MALSRLAQQFADEIRNHDWSDAPYRADRAGHSREHDTNLGATPKFEKPETDSIRMNVMWVTAQVLRYNDPNLDEFEFAEACGVKTTTRSGRPRDGGITAGLRFKADGDGIRRCCRPGTWEIDE